MDDQPVPPLRWGVLGTGRAAELFVEDVARHRRDARPAVRDAVEVVAVGSDDAAQAEAFGDRLGIAHRYGTPADLIADPEVDAVLIATPHARHLDHAVLAIRSGRHVLVESPFMANSTEAQVLTAAARPARAFAMEAAWERFLPRAALLGELVTGGAIGALTGVTVAHGGAGGAASDAVPFAALARAVSFASMVLGPPDEVEHIRGAADVDSADSADSAASARGVDGSDAPLLELRLAHRDGTHSSFAFGPSLDGPVRATVLGAAGRIEVPDLLDEAAGLVLIGPDGSSTHRRPEVIGTGRAAQAVEVARRVAAVQYVSPVLPLSESVQTLRVLDEVRRRLGIEPDPTSR